MQQWCCTDYLQCSILCYCHKTSFLLLFFIASNLAVSEGLRYPDEMGRCNAVASQASHHGISLDPHRSFSLQGPERWSDTQQAHPGLFYAQLGVCIKPNSFCGRVCLSTGKIEFTECCRRVC